MTAKPIILPHKMPALLTEAQQDCCDKIQEVLDQCKAGNIHTVGIVVCMKDGFAATVGGNAAAELNIGIDYLKHSVLDKVFENMGRRRQ